MDPPRPKEEFMQDTKQQLPLREKKDSFITWQYQNSDVNWQFDAVPSDQSAINQCSSTQTSFYESVSGYPIAPPDENAHSPGMFVSYYPTPMSAPETASNPVHHTMATGQYPSRCLPNDFLQHTTLPALPSSHPPYRPTLEVWESPGLMHATPSSSQTNYYDDKSENTQYYSPSWTARTLPNESLTSPKRLKSPNRKKRNIPHLDASQSFTESGRGIGLEGPSRASRSPAIPEFKIMQFPMQNVSQDATVYRPTDTSLHTNPDQGRPEKVGTTRCKKNTLNRSSEADGFVNFTPNDDKAILQGVHPSGGLKTKARRRKEAKEKRRQLVEAVVEAIMNLDGVLDKESVERLLNDQ